MLKWASAHLQAAVVRSSLSVEDLLYCTPGKDSPRIALRKLSEGGRDAASNHDNRQ